MAVNLDPETTAHDIDNINDHIAMDKDGNATKYKICNQCNRPTAGHPKDKDGNYPGYGDKNCILAPVTPQQRSELCKELRREEDRRSQDNSTEEADSNAQKIGEILTCNQCHFRAGNEEDLTRHKKNHHMEKIACDQCYYYTTNEDEMRKHMATSHVNTYFCDQCNYSFQNEHDLQTHKTTAHATEFYCDQCEFTADNQNALTYHTGTTHEMPCDQCNFTADNQDALTHHKGITHGARNKDPVLGFQCKQCKQYFIDTTELQEHIKRNHQQERVPEQQQPETQQPQQMMQMMMQFMQQQQQQQLQQQQQQHCYSSNSSTSYRDKKT